MKTFALMTTNAFNSSNIKRKNVGPASNDERKQLVIKLKPIQESILEWVGVRLLIHTELLSLENIIKVIHSILGI